MYVLSFNKTILENILGPTDIYCEPISCAMDYGWWRVDPALKDENWYQPDSYHPMQISEKSRYFLLKKMLYPYINFEFFQIPQQNIT